MKEKIVVSLSTIPPRFKDLGGTISCLINQDYPADEVHVYIPKTYRRFPKHSFSLPEIPRGGGKVKIKVVDEDLGPATKVLYCAKAHWGTNTRIIYCDDDRLPDRNWLKTFIQATNENPDKAVVSRGLSFKDLGLKSHSDYRYPRAVKRKVIENPEYIGARIFQKVKEVVFQQSFKKPSRFFFKRSGYIDIAEGFGGVSIKPEFFDNDAFDIPNALWTVDDIWLSGLLELQNIGIWAANSIPFPINNKTQGESALSHGFGGGLDRFSTNQSGVKYFQDKFSIWK